MFDVWEYEKDSWRFILFLKLVKDLMALTLDGRRFHKCAPLYQKLRFKKSVGSKQGHALRNIEGKGGGEGEGGGFLFVFVNRTYFSRE